MADPRRKPQRQNVQHGQADRPQAASLQVGGIKDLLQRAVEEVELLHAALKAEHTALGKNSLAAFEKALEKKVKHTANVEQIEQGLFSLLRNSGYSWDKQGVADYVATLQSPAEQRSILKQWNKLTDRIKQCQQQNQINGRVLNLASVNIRQALDILTGQDPAAKTYAADGKASKDDKGSIAVA